MAEDAEGVAGAGVVLVGISDEEGAVLEDANWGIAMIVVTGSKSTKR